MAAEARAKEPGLSMDKKGEIRKRIAEHEAEIAKLKDEFYEIER